MISTGDFKRGLRILVDGDPWVILDVHVQSPSARGASSLSKLKIRNLRTGQVLDKTFRGGDKVEEADMELRPVHTTVAPASPSAMAMPRPAPRVAPATTATRPRRASPSGVHSIA